MEEIGGWIWWCIMLLISFFNLGLIIYIFTKYQYKKNSDVYIEKNLEEISDEEDRVSI